MAGRRLSSNDVSVVIALAIVLLVLLLVFVVERRAGRGDEADAAGAFGVRPARGASAVASFGGAQTADATIASARDACAAATTRLPGQSDEAVAARLRDEALDAIVPVLDAHPEARARAAGLYFRAARERYEGRVSDACQERVEDCSANELRRRDDGGGAEALARLAVESADPQVYAWAYRACAAAPRGSAGSCQLVNALQWARLDPSNAEPWFAVAREARSRRDGAGLDDAMFRVTAASVDDAGWGRLADEMVKAAPQDERLLVGTWLAAADAMSYETLDLVMPDLSTYCDARALANANRRDTCDKIATLLVDRSRTLLGRSVGADLGKRLDWSRARLAAIDEEVNAARAIEARDELPSTEPLGCDVVRGALLRRVEVGRLGEVEALRRRFARSGEPVAVLAEEGRRLARSAEEAQAAASAASAATAAGP